MKAVAWLVVGSEHMRAVYLDHERALQQCAQGHGIIRPLVYEDQVEGLVSTAYAAGLDKRLLTGAH